LKINFIIPKSIFFLFPKISFPLVLFTFKEIILLMSQDSNILKYTEIKANLGKEFFIYLEANPTTGYNWEAKFDENFLELKKETFKPFAPDTVGMGGKEEFLFLPIKTGKTMVKMRYKRPWEQKTLEKKGFLIIVDK
jgi:inhibitor of cysteine peptidase